MNALYSFAFIVSFVVLFITLTVFKKRISPYFLVLFAAILVSNFGYMQMCNADNERVAVYANQTIYLGASFSYFFLFMCISDLCKTSVPAFVQAVFMMLGGVVFYFASTIGTTDLFYKSIEVVNHNGVYMLVKDYGPMHVLFPVMIFMSFAGSLYTIIRSFFHGKDISYLNSIVLLIILIVEIAAYSLEKLSGWGIPILPLSLVIGEIIIMVLLTRISLYDVVSTSSDFHEKTKTSGVLLFDSRGNYLGSDEIAKNWFPEISELKIDRYIRKEESELFKYIDDWIHDRASKEIILLTKDDKIFEIKHSLLKESRKKSVHCVYLRDDTKQQQYTRIIEAYNQSLEKDVNQKTEVLRNIQQDIIVSMASIVENRDSNTGGHIARTSDVVQVFINHMLKKGSRLSLTEGDFTRKNAVNIVKAAPLHDFGKIAIPDNVLNKPGKFTPEEYEIMKQHSAKGAAIVEQMLKNSEDSEFRKVAVNVAHYHHERFDGTGYPCGLSGGDIPFEARIMALADVFDALVSKRVYKDSFSFDKAFEIISESSGKLFCPELTAEFLECRSELEALYKSYKD